MRIAIAGWALLLAGCGRYADFTLPVLPGGETVALRFTEERSEPVLPRGDAVDVLNPSVVGKDMYYSEWDGRAWHTAHARSEDGAEWRRAGRVLSPDPATWEGAYIAANGSALDVGGQVWYWYHSGPRNRPSIGLARNWRKEPRPVLAPGPYMSWDEYGVADPYVIRVGDHYYMYFLGQDRAWQQRLGVARSRDGIQWEKLRSNPILELGGAGAFDGNGLGEPAVWEWRGFYWMLYTGRGKSEARKLGVARSIDGTHWTKLPYEFQGKHAWDSEVICDPAIHLTRSNATSFFFGGGNVAKPDEGLNGQIGYGVLWMAPK